MPGKIPPLGGVLETGLYTDRLDETAHFYSVVLGLATIGRAAGRHVFFRAGRGVVLLFDPSGTEEPGGEVPAHGARGPGHIAFAIRSEDLQHWREHLERSAVPIEAEVTWPSGGRSLYFRDPAGNSVELTSPTIWSIPETQLFGRSEDEVQPR